MSYATKQRRMVEEQRRRREASAMQSVADRLPEVQHPVILVTEEKVAEVRKRYGIQAPEKSEKQRAAEHFARKIVDRNVVRVASAKFLQKKHPELAETLDAALTDPAE